MSWRLFIRPQVEVDISEAADWYEERSEGLGADFAREVRQAIDSLTDNPLLHPVRHRRLKVHWVIPKRFPYRIAYTIEGDSVVVLCVVHAKRHDREWKKRL